MKTRSAFYLIFPLSTSRHDESILDQRTYFHFGKIEKKKKVVYMEEKRCLPRRYQGARLLTRLHCLRSVAALKQVSIFISINRLPMSYNDNHFYIIIKATFFFLVGGVGARGWWRAVVYVNSVARSD